MTAPQKSEYAGIDYFRLAAAFLVVAIHTSPLSGLNETADFVLTRVLARVAVPFFFMVSGFFLFPETETGSFRSGKPAAFFKKTAGLYVIAILLYFPLNVYAGTLGEWRHLPELLKDIVFDGTFYHLWYLPAAISGACITWILLKRLKPEGAFIIGLILYLAGLFGDSYYGISERIPFLRAVYQCLFFFSDYTRNGLFFAPVFFTLGALLSRSSKRQSLKTCLTGLAGSVALLLTEGLLLHYFQLQRHDSMYLALLPCMYFLFQSLLFLRGKSLRALRNLSMLIYLIHPAVIVAVRGFAKATGLQRLLIDNSSLHFLAVAGVSFAAALVIVMLPDVIRTYRVRSKQGHTDRAWAEINMENLRHNVQVLRESLPDGCEIMAVVKANAYGHGAAEVSTLLNRMGVDTFAVATIDEGIGLRKNGIKGEILILGYTAPSRAAELSRYRLSQTIVDAEHAESLNHCGRPIPVHIKVDTGMHRLGESFTHVPEIARMFEFESLKIKGIFTHLCVSDSPEADDIDFTKKQIRDFYRLLDELKERRVQVPKIHIQSSYGVLNYPELQCGCARVGIALYGVLSAPGAQTKLSVDLRPALSLKSRVALVRTVEEGDCVGYGRAFAAQQETKIAVIPIGYADGFPRGLSDGKGHALIRGRRVPIVGRICMDQFTADVTEIPDIEVGDIVTLIGKDGAEEITAEQAASDAGTITNELLSRLSDRLARIYVDAAGVSSSVPLPASDAEANGMDSKAAPSGKSAKPAVDKACK